MTMSLMLAALLAGGEPMVAEVTTDPITEHVRAIAVLRTPDYRLEVGCTPNEVRRVWIRLVSNRWFRPGNVFNHHTPFTHRFDEQRPRNMMWRVDERSALLVGRDRVDPFIRQLLAANQLIIRAPGPERRRQDHVFELENAQAAITEALNACGDDLLSRPPSEDGRLRLPRIRPPRIQWPRL